MRALINQVIPFTSIDGPGNRMAIFFQGCNLKCTYCHNPETISHCKNCGQCVPYCKAKALEIKDKKVVWHKEKCENCDTCIKTCKDLSSPKVKNYSVDELFEMIRKISPFIQGITVSGGECTLNTEFLIALFTKVKAELNLTCFVDTNGIIDLTNQQQLVDITDQFMLDVKSIDEQEHIQITGLSNQKVLKNLDYLLEQNKLYEVRTVVAPHLDNEKTIQEVAKIVGNKCYYKLNAYRKHGVRKEGLSLHGEEGPDEIEMKYYRSIIDRYQ